MPLYRRCECRIIFHPHDARTLSVSTRTQSCNIAFLTDLGHATGLLDRVRPAHALVLEPITTRNYCNLTPGARGASNSVS